MVAKNDVTGDDIKSRGNSKEYEDNWERIFGKKEESGKILAEVMDKAFIKERNACPNYPNACFCTGICQKERERAVAQNGNVGYTDEDINT